MKKFHIMKFSILVVLVLFAHKAFAVYGIVFEKQGNVLILTTPNSSVPYLAVTNYLGTNATIGKHLSFQAKHIGTYDWGSNPIQLWDAAPNQPTSNASTPQDAAQLAAEIKSLNGQIAELESQRAEKIKRYNALIGARK